MQWKEAADSWTASEDVSEEAATGTVHTIAGLHDGVEHTVRVVAVNDAGPGPASGAVSGTPGTLWSATLTVGTAKDFAGYSSFAQGEENNTSGALSSDTITLDDSSYTVRGLGVLNGKLILSVMPTLTADFVLVVGSGRIRLYRRIDPGGGLHLHHPVPVERPGTGLAGGGRGRRQSD